MASAEEAKEKVRKERDSKEPEPSRAFSATVRDSLFYV